MPSKEVFYSIFKSWSIVRHKSSWDFWLLVECCSIVRELRDKSFLGCVVCHFYLSQVLRLWSGVVACLWAQHKTEHPFQALAFDFSASPSKLNIVAQNIFLAKATPVSSFLAQFDWFYQLLARPSSSVLATVFLVLKPRGAKEGGILVAGRSEAERVILVAIVLVGSVNWCQWGLQNYRGVVRVAHFVQSIVFLLFFLIRLVWEEDAWQGGRDLRRHWGQLMFTGVTFWLLNLTMLLWICTFRFILLVRIFL